VLLLPYLSDANDNVRIAPRSRRRGIALMMGSDDALFAPALVLLSLIAMQPIEFVAVVRQ
jgi:hypothetical protein